MTEQDRFQDYFKRFYQIRSQTEKICEPLSPEDTVVQPVVDVSPPKWHLAHSSWFFETFVLEPNLPDYQIFNPHFSYLFNSYYNSVGSRVMRDQRGTLTRPPLTEIYAYREYVNKNMEQLLQHYSDKITAAVWPVLELGLQHEQQHQELLVTDIKYILSTSPLMPAYLPPVPPATSTPAPAAFLEIPSGFYQIGYSGNNFCFDNELQAHQVWLPNFRVQNRLVTNAEYAEFIKAGGYTNFRYWLGEGYELVQKNNWEAPLYWVKQENNWFRFTLRGLEPINPNAPVCHVSFYEAAAYAQWAGKRLLTEYEWEAVTQVFPPQANAQDFLEANILDPQPLKTTDQENTCHQLLGNVWEWTYSAYTPYPGFETAPGALGEYNGKFMINQMVLRGGSCATPRSHIRNTYRNFFHPDKRWQFSGIRLAEKLFCFFKLIF